MQPASFYVELGFFGRRGVNGARSDFFPFDSGVLELFPICKDPKIAVELSVLAGVGSACGMQRQARGRPLDAGGSTASSDWMLAAAVACRWLMG